MGRKDTLTAGMDNVLAWRLGEACNTARDMPSGDYIDRGLALQRCLEEKGFGIVKLTDDHFYIGQA